MERKFGGTRQGFASAFIFSLGSVGILLFVAPNVLWLIILVTQKLEIVYPLQIALVFLFSTLASILVFGEKLSPVSVAGLALAVCGAILITSG